MTYLNTPHNEAYQKLTELGWELLSVKQKNGLWVAKGKGPGENEAERIGQSPEMAVAGLVLFAQRSNQIRQKSARQSISAWTHDFRPMKHDIARAYAKLPAFENKAVPAWRALAEESRRQADAIRKQIQVETTDNPEPYMSHKEMAHDVHHKKHYHVTRANSDHPVWTPEDVMNFRLVHDVIGHAQGDAGYDWEGEHNAFAHHAPWVTPLAREALFTETLGRAAYDDAFHGHGPKRVALMSDYLNEGHKTEGDHVTIPHGATPDTDAVVNEIMNQMPDGGYIQQTAQARDLFVQRMMSGAEPKTAHAAAQAYLAMGKVPAAEAEAIAERILTEYLARAATKKVTADTLAAKLGMAREANIPTCDDPGCWHCQYGAARGLYDHWWPGVPTHHEGADIQEKANKNLERIWARNDIKKNEALNRAVYNILAVMRPDPESIANFRYREWVVTQIKRGLLYTLDEAQDADQIYHQIGRSSNHYGGEFQRIFKFIKQAKHANIPAPDLLQTSFSGMLNWTHEVEEALRPAEEWKNSPTIFKLDDGYHFVRLFSEDMRKEGNLMGHCIGGYTYKGQEGTGYQYYSLRDKKNLPHVTIETTGPDTDPSEQRVIQIQGKEDSRPIEKYRQMVKLFFEHMGIHKMDQTQEQERETYYHDRFDNYPVPDVIRSWGDVQELYQTLAFWAGDGGEEDIFDGFYDEYEDDDPYFEGDYYEDYGLEPETTMIREYIVPPEIPQFDFNGLLYDTQLRGHRSGDGATLAFVLRYINDSGANRRGDLLQQFEQELRSALETASQEAGTDVYAERGYLALEELSEEFSLGGSMDPTLGGDPGPKPDPLFVDNWMRGTETNDPNLQANPWMSAEEDAWYKQRQEEWYQKRNEHNFLGPPADEWNQWYQQYPHPMAYMNANPYPGQVTAATDSEEQDPEYRFVYYNTGLNVEPWHHNLRFQDMARKLLKDFGLDETQHAFDDNHNEWASGDVYRDGGEWAVELKNLASQEIQLQALDAIHAWLDGEDWEDDE